MAGAPIGILTFLGMHRASQGVKQALAVYCPDRYVLGLLVRYVRDSVLKRPARVVRWSKSEAPQLRAWVTEVPLLGRRPLLVVLGAPRGWTKGLKPARDVYVIVQEASADKAALVGERYNWRDRALILRALDRVIGVPWHLTKVKALDWTWCREWSDYEPFLAKGKLLGWTQEKLRRQVAYRTPGNLFGLIRTGEFWSIKFLGQRYGRVWLYKHLMDFTVNVALHHVLTEKGIPEGRIGRFLELPDWQAEQVSDAAADTELKKVVEFARRLVKFDTLVEREPDRGMDLLLMGADL